jgi:hypothetical protein
MQHKSNFIFTYTSCCKNADTSKWKEIGISLKSATSVVSRYYIKMKAMLIFVDV